MTPDQYFQAALTHHRQGALKEAERFYRQLLAIAPQHVHGLHYLGVLCHQAGRHDEAISLIEQAIRLLPQQPDQHNNLGLALRAAGQLPAAIQQFERALQLNPQDADLWLNIASSYHVTADLQAAARCYRQALQLAPHEAEIRQGLLQVLQALGNQAQREGQAALAADFCREAISLQPHDAALHYNLGNALRELGMAAEAAACYRQSLVLAPNDADTHNNLGNVLRELHFLPEAIACYEQALKLNPKLYHARVHLAHQRQHICDWRFLDDDVKQIRQWVAEIEHAQVSPFAFLAMPGTTAAEQLRCAQQWTRNRYQTLLQQPPLNARNTARPKKAQLHIGYLSGDFRLHPLASLITEMLELHDRQVFRISAYSYAHDDETVARKRLEAAVDQFVDIRSLSLAQAAQRIHEDGVDILLDLTGYTQASRSGILALRPAPIQASWLGFPGSMGAPFVDYLISDAVITPLEQRAHYSETLALLPQAYQPNNNARTLAASTARSAHGLPEQGLVFCCFNQSFKITPEVFACWMRLLLATPDSVLWLLECNSLATANLRQAAQDQGVDADRLVFAPRLPLDQHLARHAHADLVLDTRPYNAHTTASDALWMGVPLITCAGDTFASRVAASLLQAAGLPELVTDSPQAYETLALELAQDHERLQQYRARLAQRQGALFDTPAFTRELETLYLKLWQAQAPN